MAFYILVYYSGGNRLRPEQVEGNRRAWRLWNGELNETYGIKTSKGVVVRGDGVDEYRGDFRGASIIEAESLAQATEIAKKSPAIAYGGKVEVFEEF